MVEIVGDASSLHRALDESEKKTSSLGSKLGGLGKAAALAGGAAGVALLTEGLKASIDVAMKDQESMAKLSAAFKASGVSAQKHAKDIQAAQDAGRRLGFENSAVTDSLAKLIIPTKNMGMAARDLAIAENIARFKHIDLASASQILAQAMTGSQRATKQLGISIPTVTQAVDALKAAHAGIKGPIDAHALATAKLIDKHNQESQVIDTVRQKLDGQAQAYASTAAGGMAQFSAGLNDIEGKIGAALLPAMQKLMDWVNSNWPTISKIVSEACTAIGIAINVAKPIITSLLAPFEFVAKGFDDIVHGKWQKLWNDFKSFADSPINEVKRLLTILAGYLSGPASAAWGAMKDAARTALGALKTAYDNSFGPAIDAIKGALGWIRDQAGAAWRAFSGAITSAMHAVMGPINAVLGIINDLISAAKTAWAWIQKVTGANPSSKVEPGAPPGKYNKPITGATGGFLGGSEGQPIPIVAHANEYIIKSSSTKKIGVPALSYMNATGELPRFDFGGVVLPKDKGPLNATTGLPDDPAYRSAAMYLNDAGYDRNNVEVGTALAGLLGPRAQAQAAIRATRVGNVQLHHGVWRATEGVVDRKMLDAWKGDFPGVTFETGTPGQQISWMQAASRLPLGGQELGGLIASSMGGSGTGANTHGSLLEQLTSHAVHFARGGLIPAMATGGKILADGLFYGHKGERVTPAKVSRGAGPIQLHTTIELNGRVVGKAVQDYLGEQARWGGPGLSFNP
jgi:hypothetical protein